MSDDLLTQHAEEVRLTLETLNRPKKLPSVVDGTRLKWTIALALAALRERGDFIETGVYYGGTTIAMMRVLDRAGRLTASTGHGLGPVAKQHSR